MKRILSLAGKLLKIVYNVTFILPTICFGLYAFVARRLHQIHAADDARSDQGDRIHDYTDFRTSADGSGRNALTQHSADQPANDFSPAWSPDGRQIAFSSDRDGDYAIYIMNADGSNLIRLIDGTTDDGSPRWSPDGTQIIFARGDYSQQETYLANIGNAPQQVDNLEPVDLTNHPTDDSSFVWQP